VANRFDARVVPDSVLRLVRACQERVPAHLGGGAALSGVYLRHRLSKDIDLVCHDAEHVRVLVRELPVISKELDATITLVRDAGTFVRATATMESAAVEVDIFLEATPDLECVTTVDGVEVESLADLRAAKLTCVLSRSEPRDLVDLHFLDRAGFPPENDLSLALKKDAGIDPVVLAWLLGQFPVEPLPSMLLPLSADELRRFRDELADRLKRAGVPPRFMV
jgi:hypothetical protein